MGLLAEHIRLFYEFDSIFGSLAFNIVCCTCNVIQMLTLVILIGIYHSSITIKYIWWPIFEISRIFILTIARVDVTLKSVQLYQNNENSFHCTRKLITVLNIIGVLSILLLSPLYIILLPSYMSSHSSMVMYILFIAVCCVFILLRIILSIPMIWTLVTGHMMFNVSIINQGYQVINDRRGLNMDDDHQQRIDENNASLVRKCACVRIVNVCVFLYFIDNDGTEIVEEYQNNLQQQMMVYEQRQMQIAIEESRRESFARERRTQDEEYEQLVADEHRKSITTVDNLTMTSNIVYDKHMDGSMGSGTSSKTEFDELSLDPLPMEITKSDSCVSVRIRLLNGVRCERLFSKLNTIADVCLWVKHECAKHSLGYLIGKFQLVSTMPRTVYSDMGKTMEELNFWRKNSKRALVSPVLYVEENDEETSE